MAAGNDNEDNIDDDEASNLVQVPRGVGGVVEVHQPLVAPGPQRVEVECEHHGQGVSAGVLTNQRHGTVEMYIPGPVCRKGSVN